MSFTFRQLEIFVEAAKDGNFRKTADRIGISQPSISSQIKALERSFGRNLFLRKRGAAAQLSAEGRALLDNARAMLRDRKSLGDVIGIEQERGPFSLRVTAGPHLLERFIKPLLPDFYETHRHVTLEFEPGVPAQQMFEMIRREEVDLAVYTGGFPNHPDLDVEIIGRVPISLFGAADLVSSIASGAASLDQAPYVLPPESSGATPWLLSTLAAAGVVPRTIGLRSQFPDVLAQLAIDGKGVVALFDEQVDRDVRSGALVRIPLDLESGYRIMIRGSEARKPRAATTLEFLKRCLEPVSRG
jgi:DNA-binding transcriptional LysR family regulator